MRTQIIILSVFFSLTASGQILTDGVSEKEVADIILNYRDNGIKKFKIITKTKHNSKKLWKDIFFYSFKNDSLLNHKYEKYKAQFIVKNDQFIYVETQEDKNATEDYYNKNVTKTRDSANVIFRDYYKIVANDTILISRNKTIKDSTINKIVITRFHTTDSTSQINKTIKIYLKGDTIQTIDSLGTGEGMFLTYNNKEFITIEKKENQKIWTTYINETGLIWNTSPRKYYFKKYINTKTIYYNRIGLIENVIIENKEIETKYKNNETITLTPVILK